MHQGERELHSHVSVQRRQAHAHTTHSFTSERVQHCCIILEDLQFFTYLWAVLLKPVLNAANYYTLHLQRMHHFGDSPPQGNHQLDLDSVRHQDAHHLLVGSFFDSSTQRTERADSFMVVSVNVDDA